jgi:hypothetical protein
LRELAVNQGVLPAPYGFEVHDWEILLELAWRARWDGSRLGRAMRPGVMRLGRPIGPEGMLDVMLRAGPRRLLLAKLRATGDPRTLHIRSYSTDHAAALVGDTAFALIGRCHHDGNAQLQNCERPAIYRLPPWGARRAR